MNNNHCKQDNKYGNMKTEQNRLKMTYKIYRLEKMGGKAKMKKTNLRKNKGITLIALVITIIVLLILAGVAISMLSGENGILRKAAEAKTKTEEGQKQEEIALASMELETHFQTKSSKYKCRYGCITGFEFEVTTAKDLEKDLPERIYSM